MKLRMIHNEERGTLITFCGLDGSGKTTQINRLMSYLREKGYVVFITKQPTEFVRKSEIFRNYMDTDNHNNFDYRALSLLCAADRVQHSNRIIAEKLKEGYIVISDRYFYSCLANLKARGYENDMWIYDIAQFIPMPDFSFFMDIEVETAIKRVRSRINEKERFIDIPLQYKLREQYIKICNENSGILISSTEDEFKCFNKIKLYVDTIL